jgi:hypothetical protein
MPIWNLRFPLSVSRATSRGRTRTGRARSSFTRSTPGFRPPLQALEIALRNRIHAVMSEARHESWFFDEGFLLDAKQPEQLAKAIKDIKDSKREPTPGRIVAELTFGFWTAMFGTVYDDLWRRTLYLIAQNHHGAPTRLLDCTYSPFVAAQCALREGLNAKHCPVIWCFNADWMEKHCEQVLGQTDR